MEELQHATPKPQTEPHHMNAPEIITADTRFTVVLDAFGNRTFFPDGKVPDKVHGSAVTVESEGLTWEEAHDAIS